MIHYLGLIVGLAGIALCLNAGLNESLWSGVVGVVCIVLGFIVFVGRFVDEYTDR